MSQNPRQPFDCNNLDVESARFLPEDLRRRLQQLYKNGSQTMRIFLVGSLLIVMATSVNPERLFGHQSAGSPSERLGFYRDGGGNATCLHCGAPEAAGRTALDLHTNPQRGGICALTRLLQVLRSSQPISDVQLQTLADQFVPMISDLAVALNQRVVSIVESFGFSRDDAGLAILRRMLLTGQRSVEGLRAGDLIGDIHQLNLETSRPPWSVTRLLDMIATDHRRQVRDNAPAPLETRGNELGSQPHQPRPDEPRRPKKREAPSTTARSSAAIISRVTTRTQQPEDDPPTHPDDSDNRCIVCRLRTRNRVVLPCAHLAACDVCLADRTACPRCDILGTVGAFLE